MGSVFRCITNFILRCNIVVILVADGYLWTHSMTVGLFGVIGLIAFFIAYASAGEMIVTYQDLWNNSSFDIFIRKLIHANIWAILVFWWHCLLWQGDARIRLLWIFWIGCLNI